MAPPPADLRQIGAEGFGLIEKFYGPGRRSSGNDALRRERCCLVYQVSNDVVNESCMIGMEAGGPFAGSYAKPKPQNRWGRAFKF
ncbi:hypothetical protein ACSQ67_020316 [Phaseolus vulgaris]